MRIALQHWQLNMRTLHVQIVTGRALPATCSRSAPALPFTPARYNARQRGRVAVYSSLVKQNVVGTAQQVSTVVQDEAAAAKTKLTHSPSRPGVSVAFLCGAQTARVYKSANPKRAMQ